MDNFRIKGNEIKEPGVLGKTAYVVKGNEVKEKGVFGKTVYKIDGDKIKEVGRDGKTVYEIKDGKIKKATKTEGQSFLGSLISSAAQGFKDGQAENKTSTSKSKTKHQSSYNSRYASDGKPNHNDTSSGATHFFQDKKRWIVLGCLIGAMLITAIVLISQISSILYFAQLNAIEPNEEFTKGLTIATVKGIIWAVVLVVEIVVFRKQLIKRKED